MLVLLKEKEREQLSKGKYKIPKMYMERLEKQLLRAQRLGSKYKEQKAHRSERMGYGKD